GLGLDRDMPDIVDARDPCDELIEAADGLVGVAVERDLPDRLRADLGKVDGSPLQASGLVMPAACRFAGGSSVPPRNRGAPSPACGGGLGWGRHAGTADAVFPHPALRAALPRQRER